MYERKINVKYDFVFPELRTAFGMLDSNHDGRVYAEDIRRMMHILGYNTDEENIKSFIRTAANGGKHFLENCSIEYIFIQQ